MVCINVNKLKLTSQQETGRVYSTGIERGEWSSTGTWQFSDEDCEGDISDIETFEIGDNKIESVAQVEEDKVTSRVSATTPRV